MYDDLVKRLREEASSWCINCCYRAGDCICAAPDDRKKDCDICSKLQAADAIEELQADADAYRKAMTDEHNRAARLLWEKEHCWIPVTERLPAVDEEVIVFAYGSMMRIWSLHRLDQETADVCWECEDGMWDDAEVVTHWMPLPEPPKEET